MAPASLKYIVVGALACLVLFNLCALRPRGNDASLALMSETLESVEARLAKLTAELKSLETHSSKKSGDSQVQIQLLKEKISILESLLKQNPGEGEGEGGKQQPRQPPHQPPTAPAADAPVIPVLVLACNRVTVKRCLDGLLKIRPSATQFPVIVSQDCSHEPTANAIREYASQGVQLIQQPDQSDPPAPPGEMVGYYRIARHYKFALSHVFDKMHAHATIIVEDDLDVAPDFFEYFAAMQRLLESDRTLWCASAWNDNGKTTQVADHTRLYRSDFFGGLGWMLTADLWAELGPKWAHAYWDDWMRLPAQRRDRACVRPEISRTRTFGRIGVSQGQFFDQHLKFIRLNEVPVKFTQMDLSFLHKDRYDAPFLAEVAAAKLTTSLELRTASPASGPYRVEYTDNGHFERIARDLDIMSDLKSGVPRMAYLGVVTIMSNGNRIFIAPHGGFHGYSG